jgi:YD repeat-containing protein
VTGRLFDYTTGSVVQESLPSSETTDYSYDGWKRLTTVKDDNAKTVRTHAYSLGSNSNYILTKDMLNVTASASSNVKQWFDGLGRPLETVDLGASTSGKNLVVLTEYDRTGHTSKQWLPYASTSDYVAPFTLKKDISSANYGGDTRPYSETQYEASTLGRTLKEYAPGDNWVSHPKTMEYLSNTASGLLGCKAYGVSTAGALTGGSSCYAAGQLFVVKSADEDGKAVYTFTDKLGQKVLERAVNGSEYLDTYYVYDNYGNLCFVLQPEYQTTADLSKYAFQYKYDNLKRCTWKKKPGTSGITMEYDNADRMIFSQEGVQGTSKWTYYVYDNLGRLTKQGENTTKAVGSSPYLQNYYDKYEDFIAVAGSGYDNDQTGNSYGYLTGTVQEVFGQTTKIYTAYYYDNLGQVIKEVRSNLLGGHDTTETVYTFSGKPATVTHTHIATGKTTRTEIYNYTYDGKDRLIKVTHKLGSTTITLAE